MSTKRQKDDRSSGEEQEEDGARGGREQQREKVRRSDKRARVDEQGLAEEQHPDVPGSSGGTDSQARENFPASNRDLLTNKVLLDLARRLSPAVFIQLGIHLGLTSAELDTIQADNPSNATNQMVKMLVSWRNKQGQDDVTSLLEESLNDVGRKDLAEEIANLGCRPPEAFLREESAADMCEEALKSVYQTTGSFIQLIPWVDDDKRHMEMYTNLVMDTKKGYRYRSQTVKPDDQKLNSYKEVLDLKTKEGKAVKLTVFDGLPGRGKSTLFAKIAYDWATGSVPAMQKYKIVVLLKMNALTESSNLVDAMFDQLLGNNVRIEKGDLQSYMETNPEKVLILLDGFDELITTNLRKSSFGSVLNILNQNEFRGCCAFVSTRPSHYGKLVSKKLIQDPFTHVKVLGFSDKEVREYVHKFYSEEHDQAEALLAKIQSTNIPSELTESPMLLLLMCLLWREDSNLPDTMSRLYSQAVGYIFRRKEVSEDDVDTCVQEIGKVGLKGLLSPDQMLSFKEKDFEGNVFKLAIQAGILTSEKVLKKLDTHNSVQFIHKTFQEYCSGKYLQHLQVADTEEFHKILDQIMSQGPTQFGFLLRFCCGDSEACTRTILQLFRERFPFELSAEYDDVRDLALECYVEGQSEKVLDEEFVRLVIPTHLEVPEPNALARFLECVADQTKRHGSDCLTNVTEMIIASNRQLKDLVNYTSSLQKLCLQSCSLTGQDMKRITESLVNLPVSENDLQGSLELWSENLKQLTNLKKLTLAGCSLSEQDVIHFTEAFSGLSHLEELDLSKNSLHGSVALWSPRLQSLQQLQKIDLGCCFLTESDVEHIAESLGDLPKLSEVDLSYNNFLGGSSNLWSIHLKHVKHLNLAECFMEEANLETFAQTLSHLTMLVELNLSDNNELGGSGEVWCEHFKHFKNLQELNLSWCSLTGEDMKHIVQSLGSVPSLVELDLSHNELTGSGALWGEQLQQLKSLQKLDLSHCSLTGEDMKHIVQSLGSVPSLVELNLSWNRLTGSGALWGEQLQQLKSLQKLKLSGCELQGNDMNHILEPLSRLPNLAEVDFWGNESLGGSAALWSNHLQQFSELQELNFGFCHLTRDDEKVIRDSLMIQQRKGLVVTCR